MFEQTPSPISPRTLQPSSLKKATSGMDRLSGDVKEKLTQSLQTIQQLQSLWDDMKYWVPPLSHLTDTPIGEDHPLFQLRQEGILLISKHQRQIETIQQALENLTDFKSLLGTLRSLKALEEKNQDLLKRYHQILNTLP